MATMVVTYDPVEIDLFSYIQNELNNHGIVATLRELDVDKLLVAVRDVVDNWGDWVLDGGVPSVVEEAIGTMKEILEQNSLIVVSEAEAPSTAPRQRQVVLGALDHALAFVKEGIHDDRDFQREVRERIEVAILSLGEKLPTETVATAPDDDPDQDSDENPDEEYRL